MSVSISHRPLADRLLLMAVSWNFPCLFSINISELRVCACFYKHTTYLANVSFSLCNDSKSSLTWEEEKWYYKRLIPWEGACSVCMRPYNQTMLSTLHGRGGNVSRTLRLANIFAMAKQYDWSLLNMPIRLRRKAWWPWNEIVYWHAEI